jgi:hypothetical protein
LAEEISLAQTGLLAMAIQQVEQLRLQGRARTLGIEISEKRIVGFFKHDRGVEPRAKPFGERSFAGTDGPFDGEGAERQGGLDDIIRRCGSIDWSCAS